MLQKLQQLGYGIRVWRNRNGGQSQVASLADKNITIMTGGDGPPFVYLHSTLGETFLWFPFFQSFASQFRTVVPTHPGFGASTGLDAIANVTEMAKHYAELFDHLDLQKIILGGVSLGGWIAAEFAQLWPDRVEKLWICNAPGMQVDDVPLGDLFGCVGDTQRMRELLFADPNSYMAKLLVRAKPDPKTQASSQQNLAALAHLLQQGTYNPEFPRSLPQITCPTLVLWGDTDRLVPPGYGEAYAKYIPNAEFRLLKQCGHLPMFEKEQAFIANLMEFAKS